MNDIKTGYYVKFRDIIDEGDETARMIVLDDYGEDADRCLVKVLGTSLFLAPTRVILKKDLMLV